MLLNTTLTRLRKVYKIDYRYLYAGVSLGIDQFLLSREKIKAVIVADKFRSKMSLLVKEKSNLIFTEDLKNMIYIADKKSNDIDLVIKMLYKFAAQNREIRFENFVFGPIVMRMLYTFKDEETALQIFRDPEIGHMFDQIVSYHILLDLLYESKRYQDILAVFNLIKSRQLIKDQYSGHVILLIFASCYKQNTPEALAYATELWKELQIYGHKPRRKSIAFLAALALKQNAPNISLEILNTVKQQNYIPFRNIQLMALSDLYRLNDTLPILRSVLELNKTSIKKQMFVREAIIKVKNAILKSGNKETEYNFNRIESFLLVNGHIVDQSLDDLLCTEILVHFNPNMRRDRSVIAANFMKGDSRKCNQQNMNIQNRKIEEIEKSCNSNRRPGLSELF